MKKLMTIAAMLCMAEAAMAIDYYMAPTGSDANNGLSEQTALATIKAAQEKVQAGDRVYILPGTYTVGQSEITETEEGSTDYRTYSIVYRMRKSGSAGRPICYIGVTRDGQRPVFDFSAVRPNSRVTGFLVTGSYLVFRNFDVVGIQMPLTTTENTQSENIRVTNGTYLTFDNVACHDSQGIGFYVNKKSNHNLFLNCDAYNNYDPNSQGGHGGNCDGFGCHTDNASQVNNIFIGCRAWNNSDDGFDLINCYSVVTFCYSIAYRNGYDAANTSRGDGNGFKAGGYGMSAASVSLPEEGAPRHQVHHNIAVGNKANGLYANHHLGGIDFFYNTSVNNVGYNYDMRCRKDATATGNTDVDGYGHLLHHNLSVSSRNYHVRYLSPTSDESTVSDNSFTWSGSGTNWSNASINTATSFVSLSEPQLTAARLSDGMLNSETTLTYAQQTEPLGYGADFSGYAAAVAEAKTQAGAGDESAVGGEAVVNDERTWTFEQYADGGEVLKPNGSNEQAVLNGLYLCVKDGHKVTASEVRVANTVKDGDMAVFPSGNYTQLEFNGSRTPADKAADDTSTNYDMAAFCTTVPGTLYVLARGIADGRGVAVYANGKATGSSITGTGIQLIKYVHTGDKVRFQITSSTGGGGWRILGVRWIPENTSTSVSAITSRGPVDHSVYDLSGCRIAVGLTPGAVGTPRIVIMNGRKFVVR